MENINSLAELNGVDGPKRIFIEASNNFKDATADALEGFCTARGTTKLDIE